MIESNVFLKGMLKMIKAKEINIILTLFQKLPNLIFLEFKLIYENVKIEVKCYDVGDYDNMQFNPIIATKLY